ncbi:hypothetical protein CRI94_11780 [Longibacter salinarum]|uniref:DUF1326 domain-containing protein n=1 Tax=Longibacter salinarum TaxID=1850348 RepID=A0A2A8CXG8_9BACT|nr:DUF1326 domain-containing protein [Longibacter salinarum]PEN13311.1 hypothetical protein CRI94_11780 [Longibacter salinarum]
MTDQWKLEGQYMEACTCEVACPCIMLSDPTEGTCTAVVAWHIEEGAYNGVKFDDLNVVMALHTPGNMADGDWKAALYLDRRADAGQQDALGTIFGGEAGGHPAHLAELISDVRGVEVVPLAFETDGKHGRLRIGEVGQIGCADVAPIEGQNGEAPTVQDHPLAVAPGHPATVAKASRAHFEAHGIEFDVSDRNALLSPFSYAGP